LSVYGLSIALIPLESRMAGNRVLYSAFALAVAGPRVVDQRDELGCSHASEGRD
jgi:hypothetical protein